MPRRAKIHFVSVRSSLVNLPISIYGPLLERSVRPQHLAVHLSSVANPKIEAYVGWTGMAAASSLAQISSTNTSGNRYETIEIDPQFAKDLGFSQGDIVDIGLLHNLSTAKMVGTEPVSSDDWEIIEIHASHVETTLLSQVRVVKIGQEVDVWVLGRTRVRLKVVSLDPPSPNNALLLTTDTEVSIAPKLSRNQQKHLPATQSARQEDSISPPEPKRVSLVLRALPQKILKSARISLQPTTSNAEAVAFVSPMTLRNLLDECGVQDQTSGKLYRTVLKRIIPPIDPFSPAKAPSTDASTKILRPGSIQESESTVTPDSDDIYITTDEDVPHGHIVLSGASKDIEDWDLVKVFIDLDHRTRNDTRDLVDGGGSSSFPAPLPDEVLAGVDEVIERCFSYCLTNLGLHASATVVHGVSTLLLAGRSGAGKTTMAKHVANMAQNDARIFAYIFYVDFSSFVSEPISKIKTLFRYWLERAEFHCPSVLIFDNIDRLLAAEVEHADSFRSRHISELFLSLYASSSRPASKNSRGILLICTATSAASIHLSINSSHIFQETVHIKPPNKDARRDILASIIKRRLEAAPNIVIDTQSPLNYAALATNAEGYSPIDLRDLVTRALHQVAKRSNGTGSKMTLTHADFDAACVGFVPFSLRDVKLQKSSVAWSDIGGLQETRRVLRETLEWPTKYGPIFAQAPLRLRSGLLLYGYPGCGKTLLASVIAKECGLNFISVKGPEILNKYIGASEKSVRDLFERASAAKPCVLFFDEFDSIAPKRGHDSTGVTDRVVNQMLTQMDGAEGLEGVYVLAATSRPDLIDSALLRPGRLDKSLLCDMPKQQERKEILLAVSRKIRVAPFIDFDDIAISTEGYSGADLQALVYNAHLEAVHDSINAASGDVDKTSIEAEDETLDHVSFGGESDRRATSKAEESALRRRLLQIKSATTQQVNSRPAASNTTSKTHVVTVDHMKKALKMTKPSVPQTEIARLNRIYKAFVSDRSGEMPDPSGPGGIGNRVTLG